MKTIPQQPLNTAYKDTLGRDPQRDKDLVTAQPVPGQRRQTKGDLHPYLHGIALQDELNIPLKSHEKPIPIHDGMSKAGKTQ